MKFPIDLLNGINFMTVEYFPPNNPNYISICCWKTINLCFVIKVTNENIQDFELKTKNILIYSSIQSINRIPKNLSDLITHFMNIEFTFKPYLSDDSHSKSYSLSAYSLLKIGSKSFLPFFLGRIFDEQNKDENIKRCPPENKRPVRLSNIDLDIKYFKLYQFGEGNYLNAYYYNDLYYSYYFFVQEYDFGESNNIYKFYKQLQDCIYIPRLIGSHKNQNRIQLPVLQHDFTTNFVSIWDGYTLTPTEKTKVIIQLLIAIHNMHKKGIFHRDINSLHILFDRNKNAYLQITNQARIYAEPKENGYDYNFIADEDIGAVYYISPEQFSSHSYTYLTDLYSIGIIACLLMLDSSDKKNHENILRKLRDNGYTNDSLPEGAEKEVKIKELISTCLKGKEKSFYRTTALILLYMIRENKLFYVGTDERQIEKLFAENDDIYQEVNIIGEFPDFQYFKKEVIDDSKKNESSDSFFYLGLIYQNGFSVEKDLKKAVEYYKISSEKNMDAAFNLGVIYSTEYGEYRNEALAQLYFHKAMELGSYLAEFNMANTYRSLRDYKRAIECYLEAGDKGFIAKAYHNLGLIYCSSIQDYQNIEVALEYFKKAADLGFAQSNYNIGIILLQTNKKEESRKYFLVSAQHGVSDAYYFLSLTYDQEDSKYVEYLSKAAKMLNLKAAVKLGYHWKERNFNLSHCYFTLSMIIKYSDYYEFSETIFDSQVKTQNNLDYIKKINLDLLNRRKFEELEILIYKDGKKHFIEKCIKDILRSNYLNLFLRRTDIEVFINDYLAYHKPTKEIIDQYLIIAESNEILRQCQEKDKLFACGTYFYTNKEEIRGIRLLRKAAKLNSSDACKLLTFISYQNGINETFFLTLNETKKLKEKSDISFITYERKMDLSDLKLLRDINIDKLDQKNRGSFINYLFLKKICNNEILEFPAEFVNQGNKKEKKLISCLIEIVNYTIKRKATDDNMAEMKYFVGKCYIKGKYILQNMKIGVSLIKEAADFGLPEASRGLAEIYYCCNSYSVNQNDINLILKNFEIAEKNGDLISRRRRAIIYLNGTITKADKYKAVSIMKDQLDPFLLFIYGCYLVSNDQINEAIDTFLRCNKDLIIKSKEKLGKLPILIDYLFDFARFNIGYLLLLLSDKNLSRAIKYFRKNKNEISASSTMTKLYDLGTQYSNSSPEKLLNMFTEGKETKPILENIASLIEFIIMFGKFLHIDEKYSDLLLYDNLQKILDSYLADFKTKKMTYFCGIINFLIGCIEYKKNKFSKTAPTLFEEAAKNNEVSGYINLARIYKDNILYENQGNYLKYLTLASNSSNEAKLSLALMHLVGENGKTQDFDLALDYLKAINLDLDESNIDLRNIDDDIATNNTKKDINNLFYEGFLQ